MSLRILFVGSFHKLEFFYEMSKFLPSTRAVFWAVSSPSWQRWLCRRGTSPNSMLRLDRPAVGAGPGGKKGEIPSDVVAAGDLSVNEIVLMDRILRHWKKERAVSYVGRCLARSYEFLDEHRIELVVGEATAAHELAVSTSAGALGIPFIAPASMRVPGNRFLLFEGHKQSTMVKLPPEISAADEDCKVQEIRTAIEAGQVPRYMTARPKRLRSSYGWKMLRGVRRGLWDYRSDPAAKSLYHQIRRERKFLAPARKLVHAVRRDFSGGRPDRPYCVFLLHVQPESSIDVVGFPWSNQVDVIRRLAACLPDDFDLFVKEHPRGFGERPLGVVKAVGNIPGVRLMSPAVPLRQLNDAAAVITVSGTGAFESAILGGTGITLVPMFFQHLPGIVTLRVPEDLRRVLRAGRFGRPEPAHESEAFRQLLRNSRAGTISDSVSDPACMTQSNLQAVASAITDAWRAMEQPGATSGLPPGRMI